MEKEYYSPQSATVKEPSFASMSEVVMSKQELLNHLIENKAKHDVILATAIAGYWDAATATLNQKKTQFQEAVQEFVQTAEFEFGKVANKIERRVELPSSVSLTALNFNAALGLRFPEDHSKEYNRAIRMMQSSIYDVVKLSEQEYDAYVLNNWEWKNAFVATNALYVDRMRSKGFPFSYSGSYVGVGCNTPQYQMSVDKTCGDLMVSGCSLF